ncbi:MAG TPA: ATP-binding cassette domain-containing protein, partial [Anaerolineae bacterium]
TKETDQKELARMMVGREVVSRWDKPKLPNPKVVLEIRNLQARSDKGLHALASLSLDVQAGEIVGIAGVSGNGQRELAETIMGLRRAESGNVIVNGRDLTNAAPHTILDASVAFIPEERMAMGVIREFSVQENAILETHAQAPLARNTFLDFDKIRAHTSTLVKEYDVKTPTLETSVKALSGGNIQKLILARELSRQPRLLIAAQPTRGVDIGATEYIHKRLIEQRNQGTAILLISEDLDEVLALADRVAVMYEGEIVGIIPPNTPVEELGLLMSGAKRM